MAKRKKIHFGQPQYQPPAISPWDMHFVAWVAVLAILGVLRVMPGF